MHLYLFILFLFSQITSQTFVLNQNYATITIDNTTYNKPFLGGFNKPRIQWVDWDNDGDDDLFILDEDGHIKYYQNNISISANEFTLIDTNFLGLYGISWFYLADFNNDDNFEIITQDINAIDQMVYYTIQGFNPDEPMTVDEPVTIYDYQGNPVESDPVMVPTFIDIDNDGLLDFFTGNMIGTVTYYRNIGFNNGVPEFEHITDIWEDLYIVGPSFSRHGASAITFIDIDNDSDYDLAWGDYFQQSVYIIINIGTPDSPDMDNVNIIGQFPLNDPIISAGLNMPSFTDIDNDNDNDLFVTVLSGAYGYQLINNFYFYNNQNDDYALITQEFIQTLDLFSDIFPDVVDIDNDNDLDLFIGTDVDFSSFPYNGKVKYFENIGENEDGPIWNLVEAEYLGGSVGSDLSIDFGDLDADNDVDMIIGDYNGYVKYYRNDGNQFNPLFVFIEEIENIDLSGYSIPKLIDIDNDQDLDLFIGSLNGKIAFYENIGSQSLYDFNFITDTFEGIDVGARSAIDFIDMDNDGDNDLIVGSQFEGLSYYENQGSIETPDYIRNQNIIFPVLGLNTVPSSFWKDNNVHLLTGVSCGGAYYSILETCQINGDINNDFIVNVIDVVYLVTIILGELPSGNECILDMTGDSIIDVLDVIEVINIIIGNM